VRRERGKERTKISNREDRMKEREKRKEGKREKRKKEKNVKILINLNKFIYIKS
jgi:hypothetical protein